MKKKPRSSSVYNKSVHTIKKEEIMNVNNDKIKEILLESKIGLINAGGSCYMASIIQILIHLKQFLDKFLKHEYTNSFSYKFYNFIINISQSKYPIEINGIADEYNRINKKFCGEEGNNPMTFFTEFIKELSKDDKEILDIFKGGKVFNFEDVKDYKENFLFHLIVLDEYNNNITELLNNGRILENKDKNSKPSLFEKIIKPPEILIINLEVEKIKYNGEEFIFLGTDSYELVAVNLYTNYHSIA